MHDGSCPLGTSHPLALTKPTSQHEHTQENNIMSQTKHEDPSFIEIDEKAALRFGSAACVGRPEAGTTTLMQATTSILEAARAPHPTH